MAGAETKGADYQMLALRFSESGQWERALETAREWLAQEPEDVTPHLLAAQALANLERYPEAEPHVTNALARDPQNQFAYRLLSIVQYHGGRPKEADEAIRRAISLNPHDAFNWYHLAWMCYSEGDHASARTYAGRARELRPRDANILNLLALCSSGGLINSEESLRLCREALEVDPENTTVHNNMGVYHMNVTKDYARAEECFRRALFFEPSSEMSRSNLFTALKHRDLIYRILRAPKDLVLEVFGAIGRMRKQSLLIYILLVPLWVVAFRFLLAGLVLWCLLIWPLVKVYEYLTVGDILAKAGEIGATRGGFLGYRRWPLKVRLGVFGATLLTFWGCVAGLVWYKPAQPIFATVVGVGAMGLLLVWLYQLLRRERMAARSRKRARQIEESPGDGKANSGWRTFFSRGKARSL